MPYRGSLPALNDLVAGHIPMMFSDFGPATGLLEAKRVRPLGISTKTRHPSFPDIPPLDEAGVPGFEAVSWQMMVAPAQTPRPIVDQLNAELTADPGAAGRQGADRSSIGFLPLQNRSVDELQGLCEIGNRALGQGGARRRYRGIAMSVEILRARRQQGGKTMRAVLQLRR